MRGALIARSEKLEKVDRSMPDGLANLLAALVSQSACNFARRRYQQVPGTVYLTVAQIISIAFSAVIVR
jgi:hypothetical protein